MYYSQNNARTGASPTLEQVLESMPYVCFAVDPTFTITMVNQQAEHLWGIPRTELIGQKIEHKFDRALFDGAFSALEHAAKTQLPLRKKLHLPVYQQWIDATIMPTSHGLIVYFHEIGELKDTQDKLLKEHKRLQEAEKAASAKEAMMKEAELIGQFGSYTADIKTKQFQFTDGMYYILGYEPHSFTPTLELIDSSSHPDDIPKVRDILAQAAIDKQPYEYNRRIFRPDGQMRYMHCKGKVICNQAGKATQYFGIVHDITDKTIAELKAQEKEAQWKALADAVPDIINQWDLQQRLVTGNKPFEKETGMALEALQGKTPSEIFGDTEFAKKTIHIHKKVIESRKPVQWETLYASAEGPKCYHLVESPLFDAAGNVTGTLEVARDISDLKAVEAELRKSLAILQQSEELAQMGSWEYDNKSGGLKWSDGMYKLFQLPKGSRVTLATYLDYVIEADKSIAERVINSIKAGLELKEETLRIHQNGDLITLKIKGVVIPDGFGKTAKVLGLDLNITDVKRLEEENLELKLKQQKDLLLAILDTQENETNRIAESLHNGLGQLLYATKLNLIQLETPHLQDKLSNALHKANTLLDEAIDQTRKLSHELMPATLEQFGLRAALQDICTMLSNPTLDIKCLVSPKRLPIHKHLKLAIYRITQELANNIVKHARATKASIKLCIQHGTLMLNVSDNGIGFEHPKTKGIGLKTIHDRVVLLGGTTNIESASGKGTVINICIPLN